MCNIPENRWYEQPFLTSWIWTSFLIVVNFYTIGNTRFGIIITETTLMPIETPKKNDKNIRV